MVAGVDYGRLERGLWGFAVAVGVPPLAYELLAGALDLPTPWPESLGSALYALALASFAGSLYLRHRGRGPSDAGSG
jgi:hypothetical protein